MTGFRASRLRVGLAGVLSLGLAASAGAGCGYSLAGRGSFLPSHIRAIGIPIFGNQTTVFDLETQVTGKVRSEFIGRGRYQILPDAANVDAVLTGEIANVSVVPSGFTEEQIASGYVVTMTASVSLRDTRDDRILWENDRLVFRQEYEAQSGTNVLDPAAFFGQDANALERLTTDFARSVVSAILEAF
jgi:hypothetical protein